MTILFCLICLVFHMVLSVFCRSVPAKIISQFPSICPVSAAPVVKIPFFHVAVAFVIHIPEQSVMDDEIRRKIIDIQCAGFRLGRHFLDLPDICIYTFPLAKMIQDRFTGNVFLDDDLLFAINRQQFRDPDP